MVGSPWSPPSPSYANIPMNPRFICDSFGKRGRHNPARVDGFANEYPGLPRSLGNPGLWGTIPLGLTRKRLPSVLEGRRDIERQGLPGMGDRKIMSHAAESAPAIANNRRTSHLLLGEKAGMRASNLLRPRRHICLNGRNLSYGHPGVPKTRAEKLALKRKSRSMRPLCGLVAQSVEQCPFKALVRGSSPRQPTTFKNSLRTAPLCTKMKI